MSETLETPKDLRKDDCGRLKEEGIEEFVVALVQYLISFFHV